MGRQQGSICGPFLWLSVCKTPRARAHNTRGFYQGPPRSMGCVTFALCCRLGPWCHAIYPVLHLKWLKEKRGKVPHLPPTEPQKRQHERQHLQMYPPEPGLTLLPNTPSQISRLRKECRSGARDTCCSGSADSRSTVALVPNQPFQLKFSEGNKGLVGRFKWALSLLECCSTLIYGHWN